MMGPRVEMERILGSLPQWDSGEEPALEERLPWLEEAKKGEVCEGGVRYYIRENCEPRDRVELSVVVRAGSIDEEDSERGLAHVLEHLAFRTKKRQHESWGVVRELESKGVKFGSHTNAFTSFEETVYWLHVPSDFAARALELLASLIGDVDISEADVDAERGIVLEEWRQTKDWTQRASETHFRRGFAGTKLPLRLPIGTVDVLEKATAADVRAFYERYYVAGNVAAVVVGDFRKVWPRTEDVVEAIRVALAVLPQKPCARPWPRPASAFLLDGSGGGENDSRDATLSPTTPGGGVPFFFGRAALVDDDDDDDAAIPTDLSVQRVSIFEDAEATATSATVSRAFRWRPPTTRRLYEEWLLDDLWHAVVNRRLQRRSLEPRPPFAHASMSTERPLAYCGDRALAVNVLAVEPTRRDDAKLALSAAWAEIRRAFDDGFTDDEVDVAKVEILSDVRTQWLERAQTESSVLGDECRDHYLLGVPILGPETETKLTCALLKRATPADVRARTAVVCGLDDHRWKARSVQVTRPTYRRPFWRRLFFFFSPSSPSAPSAPSDDQQPTTATSPQEEQNTHTRDPRLDFVDAIEKDWMSGGRFEDRTAFLAEERAAFFEPTAEPGVVEAKTTLPLYQHGETRAEGSPAHAEEWRLSNGLTVVLARTELRADEIVIRALAPVGLSEVLALKDPAKVAACQLSSRLAREYGAFGVPKSRVVDYLGGRNVRCAPDLGAYKRSIDADCAPDDLEACLALMHRLFNAQLDRDPDRLATFLELAREQLEHEDKDPRSRFAAVAEAARTDDHPFFKRPTLKQLDSFDAGFAADVFDDAFGSGDWRVVLTGALPRDDARLEALVLKWLSSIRLKQPPKTGLFDVSTPTDSSSSADPTQELQKTTMQPLKTPLGVRFPRRPLSKIVRAAVGPTRIEASDDGSDSLTAACTTVAVPVGVVGAGPEPAEARFKDHVALDVAAAVLESRLLDVLRLDQGKVYDVSARVSFAAADPVDTADDLALSGVVLLGASHSPADGRLVRDACLDQLEKLRADGPKPRELDAVLEADANAFAERLRTNAYWANSLSRTYLSARFDGDLAKTYERTIKSRQHLYDHLRQAPTRLDDLRATLDRALPPRDSTRNHWPKQRAVVALLPVRRSAALVPSLLIGIAAITAATIVARRRAPA